MMHRYPIKLTTVEEDFRAIGLLPQKSLNEADDPTEPRDIPSPDPSTLAGNDDSEASVEAGARSKTARQPRPRLTPKETDDHDSPEEAGATQGGKTKGTDMKVAGSKEASLRKEDKDKVYSSSYKDLKDVVMARAKDKGSAPKTAMGLEPVKEIGGMKKESSRNLSRAAELVSELDALLAGSQMSEETHNLVYGFELLGENCQLLISRLTEIAESYNVDAAIKQLDMIFNYASEAQESISAADADGETLDGAKEAFEILTQRLMDAVEAYDATLKAMAEEADDEDEDEDCDDDEDEGDDEDGDEDEGDDEKGGFAAKMAAMRKKKMGK